MYTYLLQNRDILRTPADADASSVESIPSGDFLHVRGREGQCTSTAEEIRWPYKAKLIGYQPKPTNTPDVSQGEPHKPHKPLKPRGHQIRGKPSRGLRDC